MLSVALQTETRASSTVKGCFSKQALCVALKGLMWALLMDVDLLLIQPSLVTQKDSYPLTSSAA